jgi:hypothetical protein
MSSFLLALVSYWHDLPVRALQRFRQLTEVVRTSSPSAEIGKFDPNRTKATTSLQCHEASRQEEFLGREALENSPGKGSAALQES